MILGDETLGDVTLGDTLEEGEEEEFDVSLIIQYYYKFLLTGEEL